MEIEKILRDKMGELNYPDNHIFDPVTLNPIGVLQQRTKILKTIFNDYWFESLTSMLDIGCNKGWISFLFRNKFKNIDAIDYDGNMIDLANKIKEYHNIKNINFYHKSFEEFKTAKKYDVVYMGSCNHYLFRNEVKNNIKPFTFLKKLKKLAKYIIIIDGPMEADEFAMRGMAHDEGWGSEIFNLLTIENYIEHLKPFDYKFRQFDGIGRDNSARYIYFFAK